MISKVFLFETDHWLYCSSVVFKDNIYTGWVENGAWRLKYDINTHILDAYAYKSSNVPRGPVYSSTALLTWMTNPEGRDYNEVITKARELYKSGAEGDYDMTPKEKKNKEYEQYLKLKAKYEPEIPY
jgi:hypothetical protein